MRIWRGMVLLCSLAVGCGEPLPGDGIQEAEPLEAAPQVEAQEARAEPGPAQMLKDIFPARDTPPWYGPGPESLVEFNGKLYFAANFEEGGSGLWKSEGTPASTVPVKEFPAVTLPTSEGKVKELTPQGTRLFFVASDAEHGRELWVSDGTTEGTHLVKDIVPGPGDALPSDLKVVGKNLLFFRYVPPAGSTAGRMELWKSDGTEAGTVRVKNLGADSSLSTPRAILGNTLFFVLSDPAHGTELWKTNGTTAGTVLVKDLLPGEASAYPFDLRVLGRFVFFTATNASNGSDLWRTDGTEAGTVLVKNLTTGSEGMPNPRLLGPAGDCLFLTLSGTDNLMRLYKVKTDDAGTPSVQLVTILPNPYAGRPESEPSPFITTFASAGNKLYFGLGIGSPGPAPQDVQLWVTNGTMAGTQLLHRPLSTSDEFGSDIVALDDRVLFTGVGNGTGLEPWISDGTAAGTRELADIAVGNAWSYAYGYTRAGSAAYFVANDGVHGNELWFFPLH